MGFLNALFQKASTNKEEPLDKQREDLDRIPVFSMGLAQIGPACDQLPNAYGEFGTTITNPIPVNGPYGETVYINSLRSKSGVGFFYHRRGSEYSPILSSPIDMFEIVSVDASQHAVLYFSMYHPRRSISVPSGFSRRSWSSLKEIEKVYSKINGFGISSGRVDNFPADLPRMIEQSEELSAISPGLGKAMADRIRRILDKHQGAW
jgi:hypothetical protein